MKAIGTPEAVRSHVVSLEEEIETLRSQLAEAKKELNRAYADLQTAVQKQYLNLRGIKSLREALVNIKGHCSGDYVYGSTVWNIMEEVKKALQGQEGKA